MKRLSWVLLLMAPALCVAQFSLDKQLSNSLSGTTEAAEKGRKIYSSALGYWMLNEDAAHPGMGCAVTFISTAHPGTSFGFVGPKPQTPYGILMYVSPGIPDTAKLSEQKAVMLFEGEQPVTVRAIHAPRQRDRGVVAIPTKDIKASIDPINDVERNMGLRLNDAVVFTLDYDGGKAARAAMLECLQGKSQAHYTIDGVSIEKSVSIARDGDVVDVELRQTR